LHISISREAARFVLLHADLPPESLVPAVWHSAFRDDRCQFECSPPTAVALGTWLRLRAETMWPTDSRNAAVLDGAAADIAVAIEGEGS
jgi:hypothetical protein